MKILVGLSGGVDSAIAAYLLKQQGHDVTCAFMRNWDSMANNDTLGNPTLDQAICPQEEDFNDAQAVAKSLGLKLLRVDFIKEYWDDVFQTFLKEYERGRTPNPDILCNKYIKFHQFMNYAMKKGFDMVATGHYADIEHFDNYAVLKRAKDENKDQTYFLSQVSKDALKKTCFPLGKLDKSEVRKIALELDLTIAKKKDSTGICFIGERNFKQFLQNYIPNKPGNIVDINTKKILKAHEGVLYYTVGQRKGLDIGGEGGPWFVVGKNVYTNELYVANIKEDGMLYSDACKVINFNELLSLDFSNEISCTAKFRYRQKDVPVTIKRIDENTVYVSYPQGAKAVTCGQEAVFYLDDQVIGGGVIDKVYQENMELDERIQEVLKHAVTE